MTTAIYAFSGDPITYGHINIIERASKVFDKVIVAIGANPDKRYTFNLAERKTMAMKCFHGRKDIVVASFSGLLTDFAYEQGASVVIKGVRNSADFDYENTLDSVGKSQKLGIDTHILFADPDLAHVSSSTVKAIIQHNGDLSEYVPLHVKQALEERVNKQYIVGLTGEIGCGKSWVGSSLAREHFHSNPKVHNIELDHIGHDILETLTEPMYVWIRKQIAAKVAPTSMEKNGFINKSILGSVVFDNPAKLQALNDIMTKPIMVRLRKEISGKEGIIIINCALLSESDMLHISNNNVIIVKVDAEHQKQRLLDRGLTEEQIKTRMDCQYSYEYKKDRINMTIQLAKHGRLWTVNNTNDMSIGSILAEFEGIKEGLDVWV